MGKTAGYLGVRRVFSVVPGTPQTKEVVTPYTGQDNLARPDMT